MFGFFCDLDEGSQTITDLFERYFFSIFLWQRIEADPHRRWVEVLFIRVQALYPISEEQNWCIEEVMPSIHNAIFTFEARKNYVEEAFGAKLESDLAFLLPFGIDPAI